MFLQLFPLSCLPPGHPPSQVPSGRGLDVWCPDGPSGPGVPLHMRPCHAGARGGRGLLLGAATTVSHAETTNAKRALPGRQGTERTPAYGASRGAGCGLAQPPGPVSRSSNALRTSADGREQAVRVARGLQINVGERVRPRRGRTCSVRGASADEAQPGPGPAGSAEAFRRRRGRKQPRKPPQVQQGVASRSSSAGCRLKVKAGAVPCPSAEPRAPGLSSVLSGEADLFSVSSVPFCCFGT